MVATDRDADDETSDNGRVRYALGDGGMGLFVVDSVSGLVTLHGQLDREEKDHYEVVIQVKFALLFHCFKLVYVPRRGDEIICI